MNRMPRTAPHFFMINSDKPPRLYKAPTIAVAALGLRSLERIPKVLPVKPTTISPRPAMTAKIATTVIPKCRVLPMGLILPLRTSEHVERNCSGVYSHLTRLSQSARRHGFRENRHPAWASLCRAFSRDDLLGFMLLFRLETGWR